MDYADVVSAQVFLADMTPFKLMNGVYASIFKAPRPTRVSVGVNALAVPNALLAISQTTSGNLIVVDRKECLTPDKRTEGSVFRGGKYIL
ncbi:MAG: Rid family hydrolase [Candidatus Sulfotelmatobacter sp.]